MLAPRGFSPAHVILVVFVILGESQVTESFKSIFGRALRQWRNGESGRRLRICLRHSDCSATAAMALTGSGMFCMPTASGHASQVRGPGSSLSNTTSALHVPQPYTYLATWAHCDLYHNGEIRPDNNACQLHENYDQYALWWPTTATVRNRIAISFHSVQLPTYSRSL
jgi:hypothetical protein